MCLQTWNFRSLYVSISSFIFVTTLVKICSGLSTKKTGWRWNEKVWNKRRVVDTVLIFWRVVQLFEWSQSGVLLLHGYKNRAGDCVREERDLAHTKSGVAGIMSISQCATAGSSLPFSGCAEVGVVDRQLASHHRNLQLTLAFLFTVSATLTIYFILYQVCCLILTIL